jgi:hypothetical protein
MHSSLRSMVWTVSLGCVLASIGCGASALTGATSARSSRVRGIVVVSGAGQAVSSKPVAVESSKPVTVQSSKPVAGVRVTVTASGQSVVTDNRGQFTLDNTPVGSNQLQFDNGVRGSVNVNTERGMELNVAVTLSGPNASVTCEANRPLADNNAAIACGPPVTGTGGTPGDDRNHPGGGAGTVYGGDGSDGGNNNGGN